MADGTPPSPPPTYTAKDVEKNSPPPDYDSLFGKLKQAKETSNGNADYGCKFVVILCGSLACTICLGVTLGIPIAMIVIGAKYLDDCPAERKIPIYLIVAGVFSFVSLIISMANNCSKKKKKDDEQEDEKTSKKPSVLTSIDSLINLFLTIWFILGNVWVYSTYDDFVREPTTSQNYCDPTLYYFAFWIITLTYILIGVAVIFCCTFFCVTICCVAKKAASATPSE